MKSILPHVGADKLQSADDIHNLQVRITEGMALGELSPKQVDALNSCCKGLWKRHDVRMRYAVLLLKYGERARIFEDAGLGQFLGMPPKQTQQLTT